MRLRFAWFGLLALAGCLPAIAADTEADWPPAIEDNSFLLEEAYNQEPGVVQYIFGLLYSRPDGRGSIAFTNEWPVPNETHQLSYTLSLEEFGGGDAAGIGDTLLNYRYQAFSEGEDGISLAPRVSLIAPTGNWRRGTGHGAWGAQINLPVSRRFTRALVVHLNLGATYRRLAKSEEADGRVSRRDLWGINGGIGAWWLATPRFNAGLELAAYQDQRLAPRGRRLRERQTLLGPAVRYALNLPKGQLVLGGSVPIGLTSASPDWGLFLYLSWEAPHWRPR